MKFDPFSSSITTNCVIHGPVCCFDTQVETQISQPLPRFQPAHGGHEPLRQDVRRGDEGLHAESARRRRRGARGEVEGALLAVRGYGTVSEVYCPNGPAVTAKGFSKSLKSPGT